MEALEIPLISRISGFEADLSRLHNPSFVSRVIDFVSIDESFLNYNFWTWGALIVAIIATFSGVLNRTRLFILRFWRQQRSSVDSEHLLRPLLDEDDDESWSSSSSNDNEELPTSPFDNQRPFDEDFRVAGSSNYDENQRHNGLKLRRLFSWSDFASGKSVVKLWDGLGLGLKFEESSTESVVSMWDMYKDEIIRSFHGGVECQIPTISRAAPSVLLTAGLEESGNVAVSVWDARVGGQIPTVFAEWQPRWRRIADVDSSEVEKVYVINDSNSVTVTDMRKVGFPLESEEDTWWDADAVIVPDGDHEDCSIDGSGSSPVKSRRSVVSRCRRAVKSILLQN